MRKLVQAIFLLSLILVILSFGGAIHGLGDSLAVFRYWLAMAMVGSAVALLTRRARLAAIVLVVAGFAVGPRVTQLFAEGQPERASYTIYQKNLLYKNSARGDLIQDIINAQADFVTLQEVHRANKVVIRDLTPHYRFRRDCSSGSSAGLAVLSKWPIVPGTTACWGEYGLAVMQVQTPDGKLWVISLHLNWPYPFRQSEQLAGMLPILRSLEGPKVVAGDFNNVPWSYAVRSVERASGSRRAGPIVRTLYHESGLLRLPIDHVLLPDGRGQLQVRPLLGSDHLGVLMGFEYPD